jgi:hypothetical protein
MLGGAANPFFHRMEPAASFESTSLPAFPVDLSASMHAQCPGFISPTSFLAGSDTVQRRSSRPSSMLSCDSLLAVRLQQEELWRPARVKQHKPALDFPLFSAHAASVPTPLLHVSAASGTKHKQRLTTNLPLPELAVNCPDFPMKPLQEKTKRARSHIPNKSVAKRPTYHKPGPNVASSAPVLLHSCFSSRKPRGSAEYCSVSDHTFQHKLRPVYQER